jgi:1A family penicillin-binding protein
MKFINKKQLQEKGRSLLHLLKIAPQDILIAFVAIIATLAFVSVSTYLYFAKDLTTKENIMNFNSTGVVLLDRNDKPFFTFYQAQYKTFVPLNQIPQSMQQAVISAEDKDFYNHPGFSIKAIIGAIIADIKNHATQYGGSTITQQLVKNSLLHPQRNFLRKYQEFVLALEIERRFSKKEILEMYLNSVYFGEGAFGIESAAQTYFGIPASKLTLSQASYLAGILNAPSELSPFSGDSQKAKDRQTYVLDEMVKNKYITENEKQSALNEKSDFKSSNAIIPFTAPHFAMLVKQQLIDKYGEETIARSGFTIKTTIDLDYQNFAQQTVAEQVEKLKGNRVSNGAAVVMNPKTGEVLALVGSKDWQDPTFGKVDVANSPRQPGSSFKPIVYATALEQKLITPSTILMDVQKNFGGKFDPPYIPHDYDGKFRGPVLPRRALSNSLNVPAVEVMSKVGVSNAIDMAHRLGITTLKDPAKYGLSLVLGAGEVKLMDLTDVYATFANKGVRNDPTTILEIKDKSGQEIYHYTPSPKKVLSEDVSFIISSFLSDNNARQEEFGNALTINFPAAVKTGTTEDYKDSLTMGYTPNLAIGVWVGNNDGTLMDKVAGSLGAAPIWKALMQHYLSPQSVEKFVQPSGVSSLAICNTNGQKAVDKANGVYTEFFIKGTEPTGICATPKPTPTDTPTPSDSASPTPSEQPSTTPSPSESTTPTATPSNPPPQGGPEEDKPNPPEPPPNQKLDNQQQIEKLKQKILDEIQKQRNQNK